MIDDKIFGFCKGLLKTNFKNVKYMDMYEGYFARFYDSLVKENFDIELYRSLIKNFGKRVLELACGTGRVLIPLYEETKDLTGLDLSSDCLKITEEKCTELGLNIHIVNGNMCNFKMDKEYDVIILAHASICLLPDDKSRMDMFKCIYDSLRPGGVFVFNYFDENREDLAIGELLPKYFFNSKEKSFAIIFEKITEDKGKSLINIYVEEEKNNIENTKSDIVNNNVQRYIASTIKYILNKEQIDNLIEKTSFEKLEEISCNVDDRSLLFVILKR